jgi:tRNA threonylcarbamoyladenosine modification (KEOPS) complex Cgi121 subunit
VYTAKITDSEYVVAIAGIRNFQSININNSMEQTRKIITPNYVQFFNADLVAGWEHIYYAAVNAVKAFEVGINISKNLEIEILLYATCQDQINKGIQLLGVSSNTPRVAIMALGKNKDKITLLCEKMVKEYGLPDDTVLSINTKKYSNLKKVFQVSDKAIFTVNGNKKEALTSLVIERGALLSLRR